MLTFFFAFISTLVFHAISKTALLATFRAKISEWSLTNVMPVHMNILLSRKVANKHFICGKFSDFRPSVTVVGATAVNDVIKRKVAHELHCESYVTIRLLKHEKTMTVGLFIVCISYSGKWQSYLILPAIRWMLI